MKSIALFVVTLCALTQPVTTRGAAPTTEPSHLDDNVKLRLFLLVGQSNMAGRGKVEAEDRIAPSRVWMLTEKQEWAPAVDPLHFDKPKVAGVGLGRTFGKTIAESDPGSEIGLIPCAVGGTSIDQWHKGGELYKNALARARTAAAHGTIAGILWHQGESDCAPQKLSAYADKLSTLIDDFRKDLDAPNAPFIMGQLGPFHAPKAPGTTAMNELLMDFPKTHPNTACASSADLKSIGDDTHFDAASQRELGRRYAAAYLQLVGKASPTTKPGGAAK